MCCVFREEDEVWGDWGTKGVCWVVEEKECCVKLVELFITQCFVEWVVCSHASNEGFDEVIADKGM